MLTAIVAVVGDKFIELYVIIVILIDAAPDVAINVLVEYATTRDK